MLCVAERIVCMDKIVNHITIIKPDDVKFEIIIPLVEQRGLSEIADAILIRRSNIMKILVMLYLFVVCIILTGM